MRTVCERMRLSDHRQGSRRMSVGVNFKAAVTQ